MRPSASVLFEEFSYRRSGEYRHICAVRASNGMNSQVALAALLQRRRGLSQQWDEPGLRASGLEPGVGKQPLEARSGYEDLLLAIPSLLALLFLPALLALRALVGPTGPTSPADPAGPTGLSGSTGSIWLNQPYEPL